MTSSSTVFACREIDFSQIQNEDIISTIMEFLSTEDLCNSCSVVSKYWNELSEANWLWQNLCNKLWQDKVYVPQKFVQMTKDGSAKKAYFESIADSQRQHLTLEELCDVTWYFRFKSSAGEAWTNMDPWWSNKPASCVQFFRDGTMKRDMMVARPDGEMPKFTWKFNEGSMGRKGVQGSYIRVNNFPTYCVSRVQKNWGFIMQSCWALSASFPLPLLGEDPELEDENLEVTVDRQQTEAFAYNTGLHAQFDQFGEVNVEELLQMLIEARNQNRRVFLRFNNRVDQDDEDEDDDAMDEDEGEEAEFNQ
ncbi:pof1 [Acrasis kona]|uniref:Pof1 n=1 Tax=Acrasis kona TaxID=1008807 RepID=A0AAW2Z414_9EUKA